MQMRRHEHAAADVRIDGQCFDRQQPIRRRAHIGKPRFLLRLAQRDGKQVAFAGIDRNIATAFDEARGITRDVPTLAQQRQWFVARIEGDVDMNLMFIRRPDSTPEPDASPVP